MPAKGQHRKPRLNRLTRICVAAGTGGAALALPLAAASHASAAEPAKAASAAVAPQTVAKAAPAAAKTAKPENYQVVRGDTLSKIADSHHVSGGWHRVYTDNKKVIGADPDLIRPGQHLTLHAAAAKAAAQAPAKKAAPAPAKPAAPAKKAAPAPAKKAAETVASGYTHPVSGAPIGTQYHASGANWASGYHTGVDFLVGSGTPVHSIAAGTVVTAGFDSAYGNNVVVQHADGKFTLYAHLSQLLVSSGQSVTSGEQVGLSGATGNVTGPHLHFEVRTTASYGSDLDPVAYLRAHGVGI